jgi:Metallo-beta-lactamase superfamily
MRMDNQVPDWDEIELSIFGPGFGECLLLHLGLGEWLIVDSCVDQRLKEQPALAYLNQIGVDPVQAVKVIVTTHWHDDHIRGMAEVVSTCAAARFFCPAAFGRREILELLGTFRKGPFRDHSGTTEITQVFKTLEERRIGKTLPIHPVGPNRVLFDEFRGEHGQVRVIALSPSDAAVVQAIAALTEAGSDPARGLVVAPTPNFCSIVLHVAFPGASLLLGADLEETRDPEIGWTAILDLVGRPRARAQVFKVPHHGSVTGHHDRVWTEMLDPPICALLTPFVRLQVPLPTRMDIDRIIKLSDQAYITSPPVRPRVSRREHVVEKQIREVALRMNQAEPVMGQIRIRRAIYDDPTTGWSVDLRGAAQKLSSI